MEELENIEEIHEEELHHEDFHDEKEAKPKKKGKLLNIISNIIFIPVMAILVVYLVYAISVQKDNGVPSFFGQSYVRVLTGSMRKSGFERGDVVVIERVKLSKIKPADENEKNGSIIAFYDIKAKSKNAISTLTGTVDDAKDFKTGQKTYKDAIVFHQVIDIYYDTEGNTWFMTKGTSNANPDEYLVRGDAVIGQYKDSAIADIIEFISGTQGMIILIIVPSSILLFLLLLNIIEIVDQMMREKKEKAAIGGEIKERELEVTTIIEENDEVVKKSRRRKKKSIEEDEEDF